MSMRKIWTRLATFALVLVVMISFSACALFTTDLDEKYSAKRLVVKAANSDLSVSRQELYYGYLEWGYQYAGQMSESSLLEYIATALINNKILEQKSIELYGEIQPSEIALAKKQAYASMDQTLRSYIYEALDLEDNANTTAEDSADVDQPYNPSILVSYENGERVFAMDLSDYADTEGTGVLNPDDYTYYTPAIPGVASQKIAKQSISKIVRNLQSFEQGFTQLKAPATDYLDPNSTYFKSLTKDERAVLNREIDRMIRSNQTTILVNRISTAYNLGFSALKGNDYQDAKVAWREYLARSNNFEDWVNIMNGIVPSGRTKESMPAYFGSARSVATNIARNAIDYYVEKGINAINNQKNFPDSDLESTLIASGLADVYYIPQDVANNLYTVSHILIGFTDEQKAEITRIQTEATKNPNYNAKNELNKIYAETTSNGVSAYDILIELQTALSKADSLAQKQTTFREFINKYNSDPGMQNLDQLNSSTGKPQYEYLMSSDAEKSQMVEAFTNASVELFEQGKKGAISDLVWTDYGAHIIMYTRDVADFIFTGVAGMENDSIELLRSNYGDTLFATLTSYGNRTCFDTLVDSYFNRNYSNYRTGILNDYKHNHQITIVSSELKNFF